jgi:chemotaxis signal transduction protein
VAGDPSTHVVVIPVGADRYAIPITWIREIVAAPAVATLATAPASVRE